MFTSDEGIRLEAGHGPYKLGTCFVRPVTTFEYTETKQTRTVITVTM